MTKPAETTTSTDTASGPVRGHDTEAQDRWMRVLDAEAARIARREQHASVALIDLDWAAAGDWLGSDDGAMLLARLADTIRRNTRDADVVVPLGGALHAVLLVDTDQVLAINFVERVRHACDSWLSSQADGGRLIIGWADARPGRSIHEALAAAEQALERDRRAIWAS